MNTKKIRRNEESVLSSDDFAPENTKERVTTLIDEDIVDWMETEAKKTGIGYQTFMNIQLRGLMNSAKNGRSRSGQVGFGLVDMDEDLSPTFLAKIDSLIEMKVDQRFKAVGAGIVASGRRRTMKARRK